MENDKLVRLSGDLVVESVDAEDGDIRCWVKTDDYNWFKPKEET